MITLTKPQFVFELSNYEYHNLTNILSSSGLIALSKSPAHFQDYIEADEHPSEAQALGTAIHAYILEKSKHNFVIKPKVDGRTKEGKQINEAFKNSRQENDIILSEEQMEILSGIEKRIQNNDECRKLFNMCEISEASGFCELQGIGCRIRPDKFSINHHIMIDLKSTTDASIRSFESSIHKNKYALQATFYMLCYREIVGVIPEFYWIATETQAPYGLTIHKMSSELFERMKIEVMDLISIYKNCSQTNSWPDYPKTINEVKLPYYLKEKD